MPTTATADEAAIRRVIEDYVQALRRKDAAGVVAQQAPGFVLFSLAPPLVSATGAEGLQQWFDTWRGPLDIEVRDLAVAAGQDLAFCHGLTRLAGTKTDGETPEVWFRHTLCLRRSGGRWKIAHEHESVPFYMDGSLKAAVDLRP